jgi:hypothetical protein
MKWNGRLLSVVQSGVPAPADAHSFTITGSGTLYGTYRSYQRWLDAYGNVSNLSPVSDDVLVVNGASVQYTGVEAPTDPRVVKRQILRNAAGSLLTYYVDIETEDLGATSFTSTKDDESLRNSTAVPLFDESLAVNLANRFGIAPNHKPFVAYYANRLWLYGEVPYTEGHISVTQASTSVTGVGTQFNQAFVNRFLYVTGSDREYEITAVDEDAQTLTLAEAYATASITFASYAVRPAPALRHNLYYSEAGVFDGWPAAQAIQVDNSDDMNDEGTGLLATQSFLYVLQRRHIHRMSYLKDPAQDGGVFLATRRGCINNRCWAAADGYVYMLDDRGIYRFDGSDKAEDLSAAIQDIFFFDSRPGKLRVNWGADKLFFASHDRDHNVLRWHVALSGDYLPRHALCFNYTSPQWWIEEYPMALGDGELLPIVNASTVVAGPGGKILAINVSTLDVVDATEGDTTGVVTSATHRTLTTTGMTPPTSGLVGAPLAITSGRGKRQVRTISAYSSQVFTIDRPWLVRPDATSQFQVGAIPWSWRSGWSSWLDDQMQQVRNVRLRHQALQQDATLDVRVYDDYDTSPTAWAVNWPRNESESSGVTTIEDDPDAVVQLNKGSGIYIALDSWQRADDYEPKFSDSSTSRSIGCVSRLSACAA